MTEDESKEIHAQALGVLVILDAIGGPVGCSSVGGAGDVSSWPRSSYEEAVRRHEGFERYP